MYIRFGLGALAGARGILQMAVDVLPPTDPAQLAAMEAGKAPFTLEASLRRDVERALGFKVEEAIAELLSAAEDEEETLRKRWEAQQG
jgi:hypothetical protein